MHKVYHCTSECIQVWDYNEEVEIQVWQFIIVQGKKKSKFNMTAISLRHCKKNR